jgi:Tfp pilus assembly protein PilF
MATVHSRPRPKRRLILRDSLTVLVLLLSAVVLYAVTSLLFRSFSARRAELGRQFAAGGQRALGQGDAERAIHDLRISLDYAPDATNNRLLLAEALAQAHHPEQARSYFQSLLDTQPADGFLNLQLARLARQKKDTQEALDYYRAAAGGNWNGDSRDERFHVQLELADYLVQVHDLPGARAELLIAAADAPQEAAVSSMLAQKFQQASDAPDALDMYRTAMKLNPKDASAFFEAGRLAFQLGEYAEAARLLSIARRNTAAIGEQGADELDNLLENSRRIQELALSSDLGPQDRAVHILRALPIANARFESCTAQIGGGQMPQQLQGLADAWKEAYKVRQRRSMLDNAAEQDGFVKLIFDTEALTAQLCGQPSGDDALLLQLANSARGVR